MRTRLVAFPVLVVLFASCTAEPEVASTTVPTTTTSTTTTTEPTSTTEVTTTTTTIFVPDGYEMIEIDGEGIRLALPDSWIAVDLTQEGWEDSLTAGLEALPETAELINSEAEAIIKEGGLMLAYDLENQVEGFTTNVNILEAERGPLDDPDLVLSALGEQLQLFGAVDPAVDLVDVPLGQAIKASYGFAPETGFTHQAVQYYVFAEESVYIITFSTANLIELEFVFETIMSTFDAVG